MATHPVHFSRRESGAAPGAGEPIARVGGVARAQFEFLAGESYLFHGFPDRGGVRLAATTLDGRHGLLCDPVDPDECARFAAQVEECSGWFYLEFEGDGETMLLTCDGSIDLTGRVARAIAFMSSGRAEAALAVVAEILQSAPRLKYARILKYLLLRTLGAGARAIDAVREETGHYHDEFIALRLLGDHHFARGEHERARVFYRQACRVSPFNEDLLLRLAEISLAQRKLEDARRVVPRLLSIRPGSEEYLALLDEARGLAGPGDAPLALEGSPDHVDPATAAFFVKVERLFRKSAFHDVVRRVREEHERSTDPVRRRKLAAWACEMLANLPERLPPFAPPDVLREAGALLSDLSVAGDPDSAVQIGRFLDTAGERWLFTLGEEDLALGRAVLERLAAEHPAVTELACFRARSLVREAGRAAHRGEANSHREPLAALHATLAADPCAAVSSYAAVTAIAHLIDRAVGRGACARADALLDLWDGLLEVLRAHSTFANYTPLFLLLRKWREGQGELVDLAARMADRFCSYAAGPLDPASLANIARAARAAKFDIPGVPDGERG